MAINADVLQSALQELMPSYSELFVKWHPVLERVLLKGNMEKNVLTGPFREFAVVTDGPGDVTQIVTGSEIVNGGRNQNAARGNTFAPRMIYAFDVPGKDLAEAKWIWHGLSSTTQSWPCLISTSALPSRLSRVTAATSEVFLPSTVT